MVTIITTMVGFFILAYTSTYILTKRLNDGKIRGTFNGFVGKYILATFGKNGLYHKGTGLPVTLTDNSEFKQDKGTVIFMGTPTTEEIHNCSFDPIALNDAPGLPWTRIVHRNLQANDFGRFYNKQDELLYVPFWLTTKVKKIFFIIILMLAFTPMFVKASNYNSRLIELHRNLSKFSADFKAMPVKNGYRD